MEPQRPRLPCPFHVQRVKKETHDTFTIELEPMDGTDGFSFAAGQFNMLYVFGVGEVPISISGDPSIPRILKHTTRAVGTVTKAICKDRKRHTSELQSPLNLVCRL